jgi:hypothetical protein
MNSNAVHEKSVTQSPGLSDLILRRVRGAAGKERYGRAFLRLAWTAGPVTYLALQGGYHIGYGTSAPPQLFIYFAGYTLIAGIFALAIRFIYNLTRGSDKDEDRRSLDRVFTMLPDRIIEIRDLQLRALDGFGRRVLGAKYLLENPDATAEAVATAMMDLTGDKELAAMMRDVEVYRRNGLLVRAEEKSEILKEKLKSYSHELAEVSAEVSRLVWLRAAGSVPSKRLGRIRTRGFIGRVLAAEEADNLNLMSLVDAEEVCVLVFELICGRRYPHFQVRYYGDKAYTDAARRLAQTRREYRAAVYVRNSRLRVLAERLYAVPEERRRGWFGSRGQGKGIRRILASLPQIRSARLLQELVSDALFTLIENPSKGALYGIHDEKQRHKRIRLLLELYQQLKKAAGRVERSYTAFHQAWGRYVALMEKRGASAPPVRVLRPGEKGRGVRLQLKSVGLEAGQTLPAARLIEEKLEEFSLEHEETLVKSNDQKELAVALLQILDRFIPMGESQVQRAIESTNSAYLISLERGMSSEAKQSWGLSLVLEVDSPLREGIHETLRNLTDYDRLELRDADIEFLAERFNADPVYLKALMPDGRSVWTPDFDIPPPPPVQPPPPYSPKAVRSSS